MFKHIINSSGNVNWMAILALLTFMFIFVMSIVLIFRKDKKYLDHMAHLPLDDDEDSYSSTTLKQ
ncbi:MAG: hypothetical protein H6561_02020 [Lewinellaceae bacterium]|nr:hypothetical protein [Lewinellaceae bacterium]HPR00289.1 hypothetical protein [Saprospiraceae bacterium]